jgi:hypothetical protein
LGISSLESIRQSCDLRDPSFPYLVASPCPYVSGWLTTTSTLGQKEGKKEKGEHRREDAHILQLNPIG